MVELDLRAELAIARLDQRLIEIDVLIADINTVDMMQVALCVVSTEKGVAKEA